MITYKSGYKYQLSSDYEVNIGLVNYSVVTPYIVLETDGRLTIKQGYAWDGPSGPTIDTANFMRGSLLHDALYQLIRENRFGTNVEVQEKLRLFADDLLRAVCREDGMSWLRAWWVYRAVRLFGGRAITKEGGRPTRTAP